MTRKLNMPGSLLKMMMNNKKEIDTDNELEKNYEKLQEWLKTCPLEWQEVGHPSSELATVNFTLIKDE